MERPDNQDPDPLDDLVDEEALESFPASDPPSWWAAPPHPPEASKSDGPDGEGGT